MRKNKTSYVLDAFVWLRKKDNSGHDKCYTGEVGGVKTIFGLLFHTIRILRDNDGVTIVKNSPREHDIISPTHKQYGI